MVQSYVSLQGNPRADATGSFGVGTYSRYYSDHVEWRPNCRRKPEKPQKIQSKERSIEGVV